MATTESSELARDGKWLDVAMSLLLPRRCPMCGITLHDRERAWCEACEASMRVYDRPICRECRRFLPIGTSTCPTEHDPGEPAVVYAVGSFDDAFGVMVHALKYDGYRGLAGPLGRLIAARNTCREYTSVIAVPTSAKKKRKRGYGHAEEIGVACAAALGLQWIPDAIQLTRNVADQTRLNASERKANLAGAFTVRERLSFTDARVLVVDDVLTTGSTLGEAGRVLQEAGAKSVTGAVVALNLSMQTRGR